jgi:hypothetical protein
MIVMKRISLLIYYFFIVVGGAFLPTDCLLVWQELFMKSKAGSRLLVPISTGWAPPKALSPTWMASSNWKAIQQSHKLVASYVGYVADTLDVRLLEASKLVINLKPLQIDEVEVTARKAGASMSRLETLTTINITGAELCKAACCNLSESFETNASVDVNYTDATTGAKQIQMLGLSGRYVQMMTENIPNFRGVSSPYGLSYVPGAWMESIQLSKGVGTVH